LGKLALWDNLTSGKASTICADTNILVRYLVKDDPDQAESATTFLGGNRRLVLKSVLLELVWVPSSSAGYHLVRKTVHERLLHLLGLSCIETEDATSVAQALTWFAKVAGSSDCQL